MLGANWEKKRKPEPIITLINIVFLMLIFFLIAGQITLAPENEAQLPSASELARHPPSNALAVFQSGDTRYQGQRISLEDYVKIWRSRDAASSVLKIAPDRDLTAWKLIDITQRLNALGVDNLALLLNKGGEG